MSSPEVLETYNQIAELRNFLIGNVGVGNIKDDSIKNAIETANSSVNNYLTIDENLPTSDKDYKLVKGAERLLAASELVGGRKDTLELSKWYKQSAYQELDQYLSNNKGTARSKPIVVGGNYATYPLNSASKIRTISSTRANTRVGELDSREDHLKYEHG